MSLELHADEGATPELSGLGAVRGLEAADRERPNVSGDLPTVLDLAPMFRRSLMGYDRFQVDTYVRWAEDELATADHEREHLEARQLRTNAALEHARELLSHSPGGGDFLQLSRRMGRMLAAATDEAEAIRAVAEAMRADAHAERTAASAEVERVLADAGARSARIVAEAAIGAEAVRAAAARTVEEAEQTRERARAEVAAQRRKARAIDRRAVEEADGIRRQAVDEAAAARLQTRDAIVQMLTTGREERRRADAAAAATRERLDREAAARRAFLLEDVEELERRRAVLSAQLDRADDPVTTDSGPFHRRARGHLERLLGHLPSRVTP